MAELNPPLLGSTAHGALVRIAGYNPPLLPRRKPSLCGGGGAGLAARGGASSTL
jgi:hypothetical protein